MTDKPKLPKLRNNSTSNNLQAQKKDYDTVLRYLQTHYSKSFPSNFPPLPLAIGIHKELFAIPNLPFSRMEIRRFLARYTCLKEYRNNLIVGNDRVNLAGQPTGKVTEEEINRAKSTPAEQEKVNKTNHDILIKKAMENPSLAREFLEEYLPEEYKQIVDLTTLKPEKETYVEESLRTKLSDMVFSVQMHNKAEDKKYDAFIYTLIEHQSYSDYWIALRLLKYSLLLLERHTIKRNKLPVILPIVIYNGKKKYSAPRNIFELFTYPDIARKTIEEDYRLIDLQAISDNEMDYEKHLSFLLYTMKHIHERDTILMLKEAMRRCSKAIIIDKEQNYVLTKLILWYTDSKVPEEKKQLLEQIIVDNLPKEEANNIMRTIADSYIEEGFNKGILQGTEKGKAELIKMMLNQGNPVDKIAKITGLSVSDIQKLI
jgi:predicted transposase/invertase (TIGR01784 family)